MNGGGVFSKLDTDILTFHILPHLDGKTLIILSSVSSQFNNLICKNNNSEDLWRNVCTSTWPSLLTCSRISTFPGGYRTFFSDAFPSIHSPPLNIINPLPLPPILRFYYVVDVFLHGEQQQPHPFCSFHATQVIHTSEFEYTSHPLVLDSIGFEFGLYHHPRHKLKDFIKVKKQGFEEYLKQKLTLSVVAIETNERKRAGSLFTHGCKPLSIKPSLIPGRVNVVFETLLPSFSSLYTRMVKCQTMVECDWEGDEENKFCVKCVYSTFKDMNGKCVRDRHAVIMILNAIVNGERKKNKLSTKLVS